MGIEYRYNVGYGFLLPLKKFTLPEEWSDREQWYDGDVDRAVAGSGMTAVFGGDQMMGDHVWGFMATDTMASMNKYSDTAVISLRDVDPVVVGNIFDILATVKRPRTRIGWTMWSDIS